VGFFPNDASIILLMGAVLLEADAELQLQHRYMGIEAMAELLGPPQTNETLQIPPKAARAVATSKPAAISTTLTDVIVHPTAACPPSHVSGLVGGTPASDMWALVTNVSSCVFNFAFARSSGDCYVTSRQVKGRGLDGS